MVIDAFSKWVEIFAIPDQTAETCASVILNEVIARFGCPYDLLSDQGRNFESQIFRELCEILNIRKTRSSPRHPQCNGQAERFNRTILKMIRAFLKDEQCSWDENLGCLAAAYRATQNETTGFSPNMLMLGHEVRMPYEIGCNTPEDGLSDKYCQYIETIQEKLKKAHDSTRNHLEKATSRSLDASDAEKVLHQYQPGDLVWYLSEVRYPGSCPKLQTVYEGPHMILHKYNDLDYLVLFGENGPRKVIHHDKLKKYKGDKELKWAKCALKKFQQEDKNFPSHMSDSDADNDDDGEQI